jgi:hypothetical protein
MSAVSLRERRNMKSIVVLFVMGACVGLTSAQTTQPTATSEEVVMLRAELKMLRATVERLAKENEALRQASKAEPDVVRKVEKAPLSTSLSSLVESIPVHLVNKPTGKENEINRKERDEWIKENIPGRQLRIEGIIKHIGASPKDRTVGVSITVRETRGKRDYRATISVGFSSDQWARLAKASEGERLEVLGSVHSNGLSISRSGADDWSMLLALTDCRLIDIRPAFRKR